MNPFIQSLKIIALALILAIGVSYASAWTAPTTAPTGGNTASPLNTSDNTQYKAGALGIEGVIQGYGNAIFDGNIKLSSAVGSYGAGRVQAFSSGDIIGYTLNSFSRIWDLISITSTNPDYFAIRDNTAGANRLTIDENGNVGIGTTSPTSKLHIPNINLNSASSGLTLEGGWPWTYYKDTEVNQNSWVNYIDGGNYYIREIAYADRNSADLSAVGNIRMTLGTSGNVGIGTTGPGATLDVARGTASGGTAVFRGTTHFSHFNYSTNEDTYIRGGKAGSVVYINDQSDAGNVLLAATSGNVGIGTTDPGTYKLYVAGRVNADSQSGSGGYVSTGNYGGTGNAAYFPEGLWSNGARAWIYGDVTFSGNLTENSGSNRWNINSSDGSAHFNGNVGIGVIPSTTAKLKIISNGITGISVNTSGATADTASGALGVTAGGDAGWGVTGYSSNASGSGVWGYGNGGNVGVLGTTHYGGTGNGIGVYGISGVGIGVKGQSSGVLSDTTSYDFYGTGPKTYFNGNVGIGTTTIGSRLTVNGVIESTSGGFKFPDGTVQTTAAPLNSTSSIVRSRLSVAQSIPAGSSTTVIMDNEYEDAGGEYDSTTGVFTATVAGKYAVSATIVFIPSTGGFRDIGVYVNNSFTGAGTRVVPSSTVSLYQNVSDIVSLSAGQTIRIKAYQNSSVSLNITDGSVSIIRLR